MGAWANFVEGLRAGDAARNGHAPVTGGQDYSARGADFDWVPPDDGHYDEPWDGPGFDMARDDPGVGVDEEAKQVVAGLLVENLSLKAQLAQWSGAVAERDRYIAELHDERDRAIAR